MNRVGGGGERHSFFIFKQPCYLVTGCAFAINLHAGKYEGANNEHDKM